MSIQRYISTSFWDDEWIQTLDPSEKLLYLYLMTNPLTNIAGVYKITVRRICFDTGFNADTVNHILSKFEEAGKSFLYGEYIIIPSWPKHQNWEMHTNIKKGIDAILKKLSQELLAFLKYNNYSYPLDNFYQPKSIPSETLPNPQEPSETLGKGFHYSDSDTDINFNISPASAGEPESFEFPDEIPEPETKTGPETAISPVSSPPAALKKQKAAAGGLTPDQMILFNAAKACFEASGRAKTLMYQDKSSAQRELACIKTLISRCTKIAPDIPESFLKNVLEHFRIMANGKLKGKAVFTPRSLITPWIWELVVDSLPENGLTPEMHEELRGVFKK